jgi:hypothetical protein
LNQGDCQESRRKSRKALAIAQKSKRVLANMSWASRRGRSQ